MNLFVFGTLKKGFHAPTLDGGLYLGDYRTVLRYPMLIAGPWFAPMLLPEPGTGHRACPTGSAMQHAETDRRYPDDCMTPAPAMRAGMRLRGWRRPLVSLADHVAREHAVGFDPGGRDLAGPVQSQRPLDSP